LSPAAIIIIAVVVVVVVVVDGRRLSVYPSGLLTQAQHESVFITAAAAAGVAQQQAVRAKRKQNEVSNESSNVIVRTVV
jgi:hypothetical protein